MVLLGDDATPAEVRKFLDLKGGREFLKTCEIEGVWYSPITGQKFESFYALSGHIGQRLRTPKKRQLTPDRAGYINAIRRGVEPTEVQRRAHKEYMRDFRNRQRSEAASV